MAWETSTRSRRLPKDWPAIKRKVKQRADGKCQAIAHQPSCDGIGAECDHIQAGDNHGMDNLQWLSKPCHQAKTIAENAARNTANAKLKRRPQEQHPGRTP